jgi:signal transduction histidine kinase
VDVIVLRNAGGEIFLANPPVQEIALTPLFPDASLQWLTLQNGSRELAIVISSEISVWDSSRMTLELANIFTIQLSETGKNEPVSVHVFLPAAEGFIQAYSSEDETLPEIPQKTLADVLSGTGEMFLPDWDWTDNSPNAHLFLKGLSNSKGEYVAVLAVSAHMLPYAGWLPSSRQLFWGFFVVGMLLAGCAGYFLAKRIVRPIKMLNEGVKNIASGNLGHRIIVQGNDEIAELSTGFNLMGRQLEAMQRESMASSRRDRSRMLGEIALGFAHEIRNPLVVIKTSAELVHAKLPNEGKYSRLMGFVVEEVGRIDSLIRDFLSFATPGPVTFELFQLHGLVKDVLEISAAEFGRLNIHYALMVDAADCSALGEQNQIRQVLLNLLLNAMDAMPEGGNLTVRLYEGEDKKRIHLDVTDTGTGIPENVLPSIYQPFSSTKKGGLGLGLAKTQAIIEAHGGSLACSSVPGQGTTFTVCLNR